MQSNFGSEHGAPPRARGCTSLAEGSGVRVTPPGRWTARREETARFASRNARGPSGRDQSSLPAWASASSAASYPAAVGADLSAGSGCVAVYLRVVPDKTLPAEPSQHQLSNFSMTKYPTNTIAAPTNTQ